MENQKTNSNFNWVRLISDLGPALAFFIGYMIANKTKQPEPVIFATMIFLPVSVLAFAFSWWAEKKLSPIGLFSFFMILIMSALGIWLKNDIFIKMRPTLIYAIMGLVLIFSVLVKKNILKTIFDSAFHMPEIYWHSLAQRAGIMYLGLALINELVWRTLPEKTWVLYNMWGDFAINAIFWIINIVLLSKHMTDENGNPLLEEDIHS